MGHDLRSHHTHCCSQVQRLTGKQLSSTNKVFELNAVKFSISIWTRSQIQIQTQSSTRSQRKDRSGLEAKLRFKLNGIFIDQVQVMLRPRATVTDEFPGWGGKGRAMFALFDIKAFLSMLILLTYFKMIDPDSSHSSYRFCSQYWCCAEELPMFIFCPFVLLKVVIQWTISRRMAVAKDCNDVSEILELLKYGHQRYWWKRPQMANPNL